MAGSLMTLPFDTLIIIFKHLSLHDILNVMLTCRKMRDLITNDVTLWKYICQHMVCVQNSTDTTSCKPTMAEPQQAMTENARKPNSFSWYHRCRISHNWCRGIYREKIIIQHSTNYMPWMQFYNAEALLLAAGSHLYCYNIFKKANLSAKELLWKFEVPKMERYDVRTNDISRFVIRGNYLVCGNRDGSTAIYRINFSNQKPRLLYYIPDCLENGSVEITAVEVICAQNKVHFVTASANSGTLSLWESKTEKGIYNRGVHSIHSKLDNKVEINLHDTFGVRCLASNNRINKLAIGRNGNSIPIILDTVTGAFNDNCSNVKDARIAVRDVRWHDDNTIVYVTHSGKLQMLDVRSEAVVYDALDPFQSTLYCVKSDGNRALIVGSSEYSRCVLFDSRKCSEHVQMYFTQKKSSPIYSLDFDSSKLIAAADRSVAALNFNVNVNSASKRDYSQSFEVLPSSSVIPDYNFPDI